MLASIVQRRSGLMSRLPCALAQVAPSQQQRGFAKKAKGGKGGKKSSGPAGIELPKANRPEDEMLVRMLTAQPPHGKPDLSAEELERRRVIAEKYMKMSQVRDLRDSAEVDRREVLLEFGLMALPSDEERQIALKDPGFVPPLHRRVWTWTPPRDI
mmetsp:Transcript_11325/g.22071  ORF Transcript_11325/g.22071 Transcript_11325/m.22071 type:complete len:156 (+) Transcript_11325:153-620(+)